MNTNKHNNKKARGFSLVEMLVVIAVIGIVAAIAVPALGNITGKADTNAAKRNAQTAAMLHAGAISAGAEFTATDKSGILDELVTGKTSVDVGGSKFKMSPLSPTEKSQTLEYLAYNDATGALSYEVAGGQATAAAAGDPWGDWTPENHMFGWVGAVVDPDTFELTSEGMAFPTEAEATAMLGQLDSEFPDYAGSFGVGSVTIDSMFHDEYDAFDGYAVGDVAYYIY